MRLTTLHKADLPPILHRGWLGARIALGVGKLWRKLKAPVVRAQGKRLPGPDEMEALRQRLSSAKEVAKASPEQLAALQAKYAKAETVERGKNKHKKRA